MPSVGSCVDSIWAGKESVRLEVNRNFQKWGEKGAGRGVGRKNFNRTEYTKSMVHFKRYNCSTRRKKKEKEDILKEILTYFSKANDRHKTQSQKEKRPISAH